MELWFFLRLGPGFILEEGTYDEYENDLGITAIAIYDYQAGEKPLVGQKEGWWGCGTGGFQGLLSRVMTLRMLFTVFKKNLFLNNCKVIEKLHIQCREFCIFLSPIPPGLG